MPNYICETNGVISERHGHAFLQKMVEFFIFFSYFYFNQGLGKLSKNFHDKWLKYHLISIAKKDYEGS